MEVEQKRQRRREGEAGAKEAKSAAEESDIIARELRETAAEQIGVTNEHSLPAMMRMSRREQTQSICA